MLDTFQNLYLGLSVALSPSVLIYAFAGCVIGTLVGILPGVGPLAGISLLLPGTYGLSATTAIVMLAGIYYGAMYGGSTTSILMRIPGEAASVMTCIDGYAMTRKGRAGPALTSILGGHVDALASGPAVVLPHIKAGKLRPLAGWGAKRVAALADLPTFKELGYDIEFYIWAGMFAPTGTPEPILRKLRDTARQAVQEPDFKSAMAKLETPVAYADAPEFQKFWDKDAKMLADAIKRVGKIEEKK